MQYFLEHFGVTVAAITGVLAARGNQVELFGVLVLALVTAFGGGTVRDVLLGNLPVFWITDQSFILNWARSSRCYCGWRASAGKSRCPCFARKIWLYPNRK